MLERLKELLQDSEALPLLPALDATQLSLYLDISVRWLSFSKEHLPLLTVLASRPFSGSDPAVRLWLRHLSVYLLLGLRNRVNHHTLQQGVAALLSFYQLKQHSALSKKRLANAIQQLTRCSQYYWAARVYPYSKQSPLYLDCFDIASLWQRFIVRDPGLGFNVILQKLALTLPLTGQQQLNALIKYPGPIHEGMQIHVTEGSGAVVSQLEDKVLIYLPAEERFSWQDKRRVRVRPKQLLVAEEWGRIVSKLDAQSEEGEIIRLGDSSWAIPVSYPTARPPASLQALLRALNDADVPIEKIVKLISAEPAFSHFLTDAASKDNRMQLAVQNVKQSILTYGLERVGHMLVQYALFQRLTQHWFPLLDWYTRLAQIAILLSSELASASTKITPQYASLVTTVAISPLFTSAQEKGKTTLKPAEHRLFDITTLFESPGRGVQSTVRQRLMSLATAWEQDKGQSRLIACCGRLPEEVPGLLRLPHCISGLSLIWARQWLLGQSPCQQTNLFIQQTKKAFPELPLLQDRLLSKVTHLLNCPLN